MVLVTTHVQRHVWMCPNQSVYLALCASHYCCWEFLLLLYSFFLLKMHFIRHNWCSTKRTNASIQCTRVLWLKTFNPHKICHSGIAARSIIFPCSILSFLFSFNRQMRNQISVEWKVKIDHYCPSVRPLVFFHTEQWTFINVMYVFVCFWHSCGKWQSYRIVKLKI